MMKVLKVKLTRVVFLSTMCITLLDTKKIIQKFNILKNSLYIYSEKIEYIFSFWKYPFSNTISSWNFSYEEQKEKERWGKL